MGEAFKQHIPSDGRLPRYDRAGKCLVHDERDLEKSIPSFNIDVDSSSSQLGAVFFNSSVRKASFLFTPDDIILASTFSLSRSVVAATESALGQHKHDDAMGQPILTDPKFVIYEKVRKCECLLLDHDEVSTVGGIAIQHSVKLHVSDAGPIAV
jgi:hypothetical protein